MNYSYKYLVNHPFSPREVYDAFWYTGGNAASAINAFHWGSTAEGSAYWSEVCEWLNGHHARKIISCPKISPLGDTAAKALLRMLITFHNLDLWYPNQIINRRRKNKPRVMPIIDEPRTIWPDDSIIRPAPMPKSRGIPNQFGIPPAPTPAGFNWASVSAAQVLNVAHATTSIDLDDLDDEDHA